MRISDSQYRMYFFKKFFISKTCNEFAVAEKSKPNSRASHSTHVEAAILKISGRRARTGSTTVKTEAIVDSSQ